MKNRILTLTTLVISGLVIYTIYISNFNKKIITSNDNWSNIATSSIPAEIKSTLIEEVKNQIAKNRGENYFENINITSAFTTNNVPVVSPELVIGTWKKKDTWGWFSYRSNNKWETFVDFDGYDCVKVKSLPENVQEYLKINITSLQMCK